MFTVQVPEINKPSTRLTRCARVLFVVVYNEYNYCTDLNQKAVSTHSSLTGLISHSMPEDDHHFLQQDQPRPHYGILLCPE